MLVAPSPPRRMTRKRFANRRFGSRCLPGQASLNSHPHRVQKRSPVSETDSQWWHFPGESVEDSTRGRQGVAAGFIQGKSHGKPVAPLAISARRRQYITAQKRPPPRRLAALMTEPSTLGLAVRCSECSRLYPLESQFCPYDGSRLGPPESDHRIGSVLVDRYRLLRRLGCGGMGAVYLADDMRLGRLVAVKFVAEQLLRDSEARRRFEREAKNAATITHDALIRVHDLVDAQGEWVLVMEYAPGPTMDELIRDSAPIALDLTAALVSAIADGLAAMHARGLIHRDLKPSNVIVTRGHDGSLGARILDFGIARRFDDASQSITDTGVVSGTLAYMAPEQVAGETSDVRTDVFSLAAVTLVALTGLDRRPAYVIAMRGRRDERLSALPEDLGACLAAGLHADRNRRTATPRAFADALQHVAAAMPGWRARAVDSAGQSSSNSDLSSSATSSAVPIVITKTARSPLAPSDAEERAS